MNHITHLKDSGLKVTGPRLKILELLEMHRDGHWTAEDIFRLLIDEGFDVGLATVYRVLTQFEQAGIVVKHHFETGKAVYELNQGDHHDHIVCHNCSKVVEFINDVIEHQQHEVAEQHGFTLTGQSLNLYGYCDAAECQEALRKK